MAERLGPDVLRTWGSTTRHSSPDEGRLPQERGGRRPEPRIHWASGRFRDVLADSGAEARSREIIRDFISQAVLLAQLAGTRVMR